MVDIFTIVIQKLNSLGFFNFLLPFMLTTAIFYGLLRRSKIFSAKKMEKDKDGKPVEVEVSQGVNAIVALVAGFMVWAYPILQGVNVQSQLSAFFMQGTVVTLVFVVGLMILSMFVPPDLPKNLQEQFLKGGTLGIVLVVAIVIGVIIFVTSGLISMIVGPVFSGINLSNDTVLTVVVLGLLIIPMIFIFRGGEGGAQPTEENGEKKKEAK